MRPFADSPLANAAIAAALTFGAAVVGCTLANEAHGQTLGLHLATAHRNHHMRDDNYGAFIEWNGWVAGAYQNSLPVEPRRISAYAGHLFEWGRYGLVVGVVTGYEKERVYGQRYCPAGKHHTEWTRCFADVGHSSGVFAPLVAPSVKFPEAQPYVGVTPRLTLVGYHKLAVNLSVQRSFR